MDEMEHARRCLAQGDAQQAASLLQGVVTRQPGNARAWTLLGAALNNSADYAGAAQSFRKAIEAEPSSPRHWMNLGTVLRAAGDLDAALTAYLEAAQLGAADASFLYNVGLLHLDRQEYGLALEVLRRAARQAPNDGEIVSVYAQCCFDCVHNDEARTAIASWRNWRDATPQVLCRLASLLVELGDSQGALEAIARARQMAPADVEVLVRAIQVDERNNRVAEAQAQLASLRISRDEEQRHAEELLTVRAQLAQRAGDHDAACRYLTQLLEQPAKASRHGVLFMLAKSQDALGRFDAAYATLVAAHERQMSYVAHAAPRFTAADLEPMGITGFPTDPADIARWSDASAPAGERSPVFVVGFPRSGTTLLEQALDAHPGLVAMDEQPFLQNAIDFIGRFGVRYPEELGRLSDTQVAEARAFYWDKVRARVAVNPGQRLIDKNPLNILRLPAIRRLFPNAHIILAVRHPGDVLVSCFMQHFRAPAFARLCSTPERLATGYHRAFAFWYQEAAKLSPRVHEVRYEDLVQGFEPHMRAIIGFLGLEWHDAVLRPGERAIARGYISTPSYAQVVQPVNRRAVERWRNYERWLRPSLERFLADDLARWGYTL